MNTVGRFLLPVISIVLAATAQAEPATMLAFGTYEPQTVTARSGERWMGMFYGDEGFELRPVTLDVQSEVIEGEAGVFTRVSVEGDAVPVLMMNDRSLRAGAIDTVLSGVASVPRGGTMSLSLGGSAYALSVRLTQAAASKQELPEGTPECELVLVHGKTAQVIERYAHCDGYDPASPVSALGALPMISWAGDMDGDGRLDFLVAGGDEEVTLRLYLSGRATGGALVGLAGQMPVDLSFGC